MTRWELVCDPEAAPDARDAAWRTLEKRLRQPVLFQLRRRIKGWRLTEDLTDEICEMLRNRHEGAGALGSLRECVAAALAETFAEHGVAQGIDDRFEQDWAASMLHAALREHRRAHPDSHVLLMSLYDRPEGARPLQPSELAHRLQQPVDLIEERVAEGREELRRLFAHEIKQTLANGDPNAELKRFLSKAGALLAT